MNVLVTVWTEENVIFTHHSIYTCDSQTVYLNTTKTPKLRKDMQRRAKTCKGAQRHAKTCKEAQRRGKPQRQDKDTHTAQRHLNTQ